jgi:hypothetical protein
MDMVWTDKLLKENPCNEKLWSYRSWSFKQVDDPQWPFDKLASHELHCVMVNYLEKDWHNEAAWKYIHNYTQGKDQEHLQGVLELWLWIAEQTEYTNHGDDRFL